MQSFSLACTNTVGSLEISYLVYIFNHLSLHQIIFRSLSQVEFFSYTASQHLSPDDSFILSSPFKSITQSQICNSHSSPFCPSWPLLSLLPSRIVLMVRLHLSDYQILQRWSPYPPNNLILHNPANDAPKPLANRICLDIVARSAEPQVQAEAAAMTDKDGNVVSFNATGVYQGMYHPL